MIGWGKWEGLWEKDEAAGSARLTCLHKPHSEVNGGDSIQVV